MLRNALAYAAPHLTPTAFQKEVQENPRQTRNNLSRITFFLKRFLENLGQRSSCDTLKQFTADDLFLPEAKQLSTPAEDSHLTGLWQARVGNYRVIVSN